MDEIEMDLEFVNADSETTCTICSAEFLDKADLDIHVQQVHKPGWSPCDFCTESYTDLMAYAAHIRDDHFNEIRCCQYCSKIVQNVKTVNQHQKKHLGYSKSYLSCSSCEALFLNTRHLEIHEATQHPVGNDSFYLPCMPYLSLLLNLKVSTVLQAAGDSFFICASCEFTSIDLKSYTNHLKEEKCSSLICDTCNEVFKDKRNLINHFKRRKYKCDDYESIKCLNCKKYLNYKLLREHLTTCQMIHCSYCKEEFLTVQQLSEHQQKDHPRSIENASRCIFCQKLYVGNIAMKKHINRTHRRFFHLYKYMCKECNAIFVHPQKLFAHYFMYHKEMEPYTCKLCSKTFRLRKHFTLHIKIEHKSEGYVEFDEKYLVYFTDKKSETPFIPQCVINSNYCNTSGSDNDNEFKIDDETKVKSKTSPKKSNHQNLTKKDKETGDNPTSDDEPLLIIKKRIRKPRQVQNKLWKWKKRPKRKLTCKICKKYCYTLQNYTNHMNSHEKTEFITCVKCKQEFPTEKELENHMKNDHSHSLLTETLKKVLEKRKLPEKTPSEESPSRKFLKTIKKVKIDKISEPATIKVTNNNISAKNFLESFTPDVSDREKLKIDACLTIKRHDSPFYREPSIKMYQFNPKPELNLNAAPKLKFPQKFTSTVDFKTEFSIAVLQHPQDHDYDMNDVPYMEEEDKQIPEVAQEVMLEESVEETSQTPRINIPQLPKGYPAIHVATLQPQAPYYKIVKITSKDENFSEDRKPDITSLKMQETIQLKDGTKLVSANPLAHLLGNKQVEEILKTNNKYYKQKTSNKTTDFQGLLTQAMQKLHKRSENKRKRAQNSLKNKKYLQETDNSLQDTIELHDVTESQDSVDLQDNTNDSIKTVHDLQVNDEDIKGNEKEDQESKNLLQESINDMPDLVDDS